MSDVSTSRERTVTVPSGGGQPRRGTPSPDKQDEKQGDRRNGLLLLGLLLITVSVAGFWFVLRSVDQRQLVWVAARDIERWEIVTELDFLPVEANVGQASALGPGELGFILDRWATGRIPFGTIVTEGMFQLPPLSTEEDQGKVIIELSLPGDVPYGDMQTGDRLALFGREGGEDGGGPYGLIGVLNLDFVQDGRLIYVVTPEEALSLEEIVGRFRGAADQRIWKLSFGLELEDLQAAYERRLAG